jgi:hypothetical protein
MHLHLFKISGGYLIAPAGKPLPANWTEELAGRAPDISFRSSMLKAPGYIEEQMRINGSAMIDQTVANLLFEDFPEWTSRTV